MSCPCTGEFANVYLSLNNLEGNFNAITGNTLSNYNQLSRIVSQQANIYNTVYYGLGNMSTGNLVVSANCNISGNLIMNIGNLGVGTSNPQSTLSVSGNAVITGNVNVDNGLLWTDPTNNRVGINTTNPLFPFDVKGDSNVSANIYCNGISTDATQSPLKILSGSITTNASGYYNFTWTQFKNTPYLVMTAIDNQVNFRGCFIRTISNTAANIRAVDSANGGVSITCNYIVMGY